MYKLQSVSQRKFSSEEDKTSTCQHTVACTSTALQFLFPIESYEVWDLVLEGTGYKLATQTHRRQPTNLTPQEITNGIQTAYGEEQRTLQRTLGPVGSGHIDQ